MQKQQPAFTTVILKQIKNNTWAVWFSTETGFRRLYFSISLPVVKTERKCVLPRCWVVSYSARPSSKKHRSSVYVCSLCSCTEDVSQPLYALLCTMYAPHPITTMSFVIRSSSFEMSLFFSRRSGSPKLVELVLARQVLQLSLWVRMLQLNTEYDR
jgi:hypothetical protein